MLRLSSTQLLILVAIAVFVAAGIWGPFEMTAMTASGTSHCFFTLGETALCGVNALDHLALWQRTFAALPPASLALVAYALAFLFASLFPRHLHGPPDALAARLRLSLFRIPRGPSPTALLVGSVINPRAPCSFRGVYR